VSAILGGLNSDVKMLEIILYFAVPVLLTLIVAYFWTEAQRKKQKEQKKQAIVLQISTMKENFKLAINQLVADRVLSKRGQESIYRIANNFFVFQPVNEDNIYYCEQVLERVVKALPQVNLEASNLERAQGVASIFVQALPASASGFTAHFYRHRLPELIAQLVTYENFSNDAEPIPHPMANIVA
jgi:hypothetical protein